MVVANLVIVVNAQTIKISFEQSEGYIIAPLASQNGWSTWGVEPPDGEVNGTKPTDGTLNFQMTATDSWYYGGFEKEIPSYQKVEISYDVNLSEVGGADFIAATYDTEYYYVAAFNFHWQESIKIYKGLGNWEIIGPYDADVVYHCKSVIDLSTGKVEYFLNGSSVGSYTTTLNNVSIIDFVTDNFGLTTYYIDNIQITDLSSMATTEVKKDAVSIYPNPATDILKIETKAGVLSAQIFDASGKIVSISKDAKEINVSFLSRGSYIIKIETEVGFISKKFIKK